MMKQDVQVITELTPETFSNAKDRKVAVIVDENTYKHCYPKVIPLLPDSHNIIQIQSGEEYKTLATCQLIWEKLTQLQFNRKDVVINLGGGVIGDMGGFCAATYKRGIDFIQLPTTLLSQVDASIGGKLGIDFQSFKNHIGVFQIPNQVIIHPDFLSTLPQRELISGYAEVIKHALIANIGAWKTLAESSLEEKNWKNVIRESIQIKYDVVEQDPHERGLRKILNFGHTIGHAIESFYLESDNEKLLHGEAIAIGMLCESYLSHRYGNLEVGELNEIVTHISSVYNKVTLQEDDFNVFLKLMQHDKKNETTEINFTLLEKIGKASFNNTATENQIRDALTWYNQLKF